MNTNAKNETATATDEWKPWAHKLIRSVKGVLGTGIPECYADYPTPVEGFCFELHADLPYGRPALLDEVLANLVKMPEFVEADEQFRQKFGCPILGESRERPLVQRT
ncbi:hypothetical protein [Paraburkholderia sp. A3RO-2L]|jgi:hypothetical protein|uniref:hypothetical protein n=1 Tax=unclassified Paraburkholderia TaxID=2615204 RepID=UPI003DA8508B